jgi:hypothetical protein
VSVRSPLMVRWLLGGNLKLTFRIGNVGDDCPVFDGLFDYCAISAGGSMG